MACAGTYIGECCGEEDPGRQIILEYQLPSSTPTPAHFSESLQFILSLDDYLEVGLRQYAAAPGVQPTLQFQSVTVNPFRGSFSGFDAPSRVLRLSRSRFTQRANSCRLMSFAVNQIQSSLRRIECERELPAGTVEYLPPGMLDVYFQNGAGTQNVCHKVFAPGDTLISCHGNITEDIASCCSP